MAQAFNVRRDAAAENVPMGNSVITPEFAPAMARPTPISEPWPGQDAGAREAPPDLTGEIRRRVEARIRATQGDAAALAEKLAGPIARGDVEIETRGRRIVVRIRERGSFASGSADLRPEYRTLLPQFRDVLATQQGEVAVHGHTDDVPIATSRYRSNWELSSARAVSVAEQLLAGGALDPHRLSVSGFADTHPLLPNDSPAGRERNRRVEIVVDQGIDEQMRGELDLLKAQDPGYYRSLGLDEPRLRQGAKGGDG